jgi:hypothetical protein
VVSQPCASPLGYPVVLKLSSGAIKNGAMKPQELFEDDLELDGEAEGWDEETLGLDLDESDTQSVARELGIVTSEL